MGSVWRRNSAAVRTRGKPEGDKGYDCEGGCSPDGARSTVDRKAAARTVDYVEELGGDFRHEDDGRVADW